MSQDSEPKLPVTTPSRWKTPVELAELAGVTPRTVQRLAQRNRIQHKRVPGTNLIRFSPEDVEAFIAQSHQASA